MTTPKQPKREIETPFGIGTIIDHRGHKTPSGKDKHHGNRELGCISFPTFTVNRKEYKDLTLYITHYHFGSVGVSPYRYGTFTASAQTKVAAYFDGEGREHIAPLLDDLDPADIRKSRKHAIAYNILSAIRKESSNQYYPSDEGRETDALIDEILEDITKARAAGVHFAHIEES